ncbi:hypothetical protein Xen7305DRAFT_00007110 [Xenococcus sp. PCC 7305]|uniref:hypothetical protein n=1 Tax=Xenococcus sp. PCC 7305 TaxID=102125 RepID=UPI0002AD0501|nr:hypothetical protein [Xenococcus sp. PCC 7305]ELS01010.1 hypothetical protein Xen7305DRAFT_00007110 [Xenococcus sp. PCC 7305]
MRKSFSLKSTIFWVLGIDSLMIATAVGRAILLERNPMRYFDEGGYITWLSVIQLLFIAYLCWKISLLRVNKGSSLQNKKQPHRLWQIMTGGFIFLAADEHFGIHENLDVAFHRLFSLSEDGLTGRIDDFIILFYAVFGIWFLNKFKSEFKNFAASSRWFITGFILCFLTILLDMLSHKREVLSLFMTDPEKINFLHNWFKTLEEIPKIFAEGAFIIAFSYCLIIATRLAWEHQKTDTPTVNLMR